MRNYIRIAAAALVVLGTQADAQARGFGGVRGGAVGVGPRGGVAAGGHHGGTVAGPRGAAAGGARHGTYVGPRGTTVQHGSAGGVATGPFGGVHAGKASATKVTGPGGRTAVTGSHAAVNAGPLGGASVRGGRGAAVAGPGGMAAAGRRGGVAVGPFGGVAAGGMRGGVAVGPGGAVAARTGGVVVGHRTGYVSPVALRTNATYVRTGFRYNCFTPTWYRTHTVAWLAPVWRPGWSTVWVAPPWPTVATWCGIAAAPVVYDYGSTVVINDNSVYVNGVSAGTAAEYAEQATAIADRGRAAKPTDTDEWQPLGVFGMVKGEETESQHIFQLAVNKAGVIRGNYYDAVGDNTLPVYGSVDKKTQKAAWSIGEKKTVVFEAGLNNLTQDQTTVLVHYGTERTDQAVLVRIPEEKGEKR